MGDVGDLNATFFYGFSGKQIYKPLWSVILQCEAHVSHDDHAAPLVEQQRVENVGTVPLANYLRIAKPCSHDNGKLEDFEFRITQSKALAAHMVNKVMNENVCWSMGLRHYTVTHRLIAKESLNWPIRTADAWQTSAASANSS